MIAIAPKSRDTPATKILSAVDSPANVQSILKLAMIFEVARWVNNPSRNWQLIQRDTLQIAADHEMARHAASLYLEQEISRNAVDEKANSIIAAIRSDFKKEPDGNYFLSKTQLTHKFAHHPVRSGSISPSELYEKIIPRLIALGDADGPRKIGKKECYAFQGRVSLKTSSQQNVEFCSNFVENWKQSSTSLTGFSRVSNFQVFANQRDAAKFEQFDKSLARTHT